MVFFSFAMILRLVLSRAFGLCWVHRACILYKYCVSVCIVTPESALLDAVVISKHNMIGVFAVIGVIIFALVVWKIKRKKTC